MRAVDTNVVVRYLIGDDKAQSQRAREVIGHEAVFVPLTVILEVEWVLRRVHNLPATKVLPALQALAGLPGVSMEDSPMVGKALDWATSGMDFADALHLAAAETCDALLTFDKGMVRSAAQLGLTRVSELKL